MVHAMSGETERYILAYMPYARGLQYQNEWFRITRNESLYKAMHDSGLKTVL
jgi:hypothetical protein